VRQLSIAGITFNWPRLTWPALGRRPPGTSLREVSVHSSDGGDKCCASGWRLGLRQPDAVERAHDLLHRQRDVEGISGVP
jgi:hypothetical protein